MDRRLTKALLDRKVILFVGAGVSQNLNLPSWDGLVDEVAAQLGFDPKIFKAQGDNLELFEYYHLERGALGSLRSWMDNNWHSDITIADSKIHRLIVDLDFPKIYTTNFDSWIERAYSHYDKQYQKITNAKSIANSIPGITQIVKFHGDFDDDQSLVLTESNYFRRLNFESPLDIQLRSDMLAYSLLYIGYSARDINLRFLLYKLEQQAIEAGIREAVPLSFIFLSRPNLVQERILRARNVIPMISEVDDPGVGLTYFLQELVTATIQP